MDDQYAVQAEFYDVVALGAWDAVRPVLTKALDGASADAGPIVDIGAGTGLGVEVIADTVPEARVVAVPAVLADLGLPLRLGAVVAMNMLGYLDRAERSELWSFVRERLAPGAPAVIGLAQPSRPEPVPDMTFTDVQVGQRRYEGGGSAEPTGRDTVRWRMWFRVYDGDELIEERRESYDWWTVDEPDLLDELRGAGLTGTSLGSGVVVARR